MTTQRMFRTAILPFAVAILLAAGGTGGTSVWGSVHEAFIAITFPGGTPAQLQPRATRLQPRASQPSPACELLVLHRTAGPMGGRARAACGTIQR